MTPLDPGLRIRLALLVAVSLAALGNATSWSWSFARSQPSGDSSFLELELAAERGGRLVPLKDTMHVSDFIRVSGVAAARCHLFVVAIERAGGPRALLGPRDRNGPGLVVGPGRFGMPGVHELLQMPGPVRIWAACGGEQLRYENVAAAALQALNDAGGGEEGVREGEELTGLPPGTFIATRLVERTH